MNYANNKFSVYERKLQFEMIKDGLKTEFRLKHINTRMDLMEWIETITE